MWSDPILPVFYFLIAFYATLFYTIIALAVFDRSFHGKPDGWEARWASSDFWTKNHLRWLRPAVYILLAIFWPVYLAAKVSLAVAHAVRGPATHTWNLASQAGAWCGRRVRYRFGVQQQRQERKQRDEEAGLESPEWASIDLDAKPPPSTPPVPVPEPVYTSPRPARGGITINHDYGAWNTYMVAPVTPYVFMLNTM